MRFIGLFLILIIMASCGNNTKPTPDVSQIRLDLQVQRFEKDLFSIDTNSPDVALDSMYARYGNFLPIYLYNILGLPEGSDSTTVLLSAFIRQHMPIYEQVNSKFKSFESYTVEVVEGLKYVRHYFPDHKLPSKLITFIGPVVGYSNILTPDAFGVGLQNYLGPAHAIYHHDYVRDIYPAYQSRRFKPEYISVNCLRNIVDDIYPANLAGRPLVENMVEQGKRMYLLDIFLPHIHDTLKTGYTLAQLEACEANEANMWSFFVENDLLYKADAPLIRDYVNDGPKTPAFGDESPGNIAQYIGWQIVRKYLSGHPNTTVQQLLATPALEVFQQSKYKPK